MPQEILIESEKGKYTIKIIDRNGKPKQVNFNFLSDEISQYGLPDFSGDSDELGHLETNFDEKTGLPRLVEITKEDEELGMVYTTITSEGYRHSYFTESEVAIREMGMGVAVEPEITEVFKDQVDGNLYFAAFMSHKLEAERRFNPSHTR